jgi:Spy/CpxP family protein refolding chaperone
LKVKHPKGVTVTKRLAVELQILPWPGSKFVVGLLVNLALLAAFGGLPAAALAGIPMHSDEAHADRQMRLLFGHLHLSGEQKAKVEEIRKRHQSASGETRRKLGEKRRALFAFIRRADATKEQAIALQREISALQAELADSRLVAWFEARGVLTLEQRTRLATAQGGGEHGPGNRH